MAPTYGVEAWIVTRETPRALDDVTRGDVIVFRYPFGSDLRAIKRAVAVPGDRVQLRPDTVSVNGGEHAVVPPGGGSDPQPSDVPADHVVPPEHIFVLGDNPAASIDSRSFGDLPGEEVAGRVLFALPASPLLLGAITALVAIAVVTGMTLHRRARPTAS